MRKFELVCATIFGTAFLVLAFAVAIETLSRKLLNVSLQGVDELGGYVLAIGGGVAFAVALGARAHIRIDIVHDRFPRLLRVLLNIVGYAALAVCALALVRMASIALSDTILFRATAQTPWATPLKYPQSLWLGALGLFLIVALLQIARMLGLLFTGRIDRVDREFSPRGSKEELAEEIADIRARGADRLSVPGEGPR